MTRKLQGVIGLVMVIVVGSISGSLLMYHFKEFSWSGVLGLSVALGLILFAMACSGERFSGKGLFSELLFFTMSVVMGFYVGAYLVFEVLGWPIQTNSDFLVWLLCSSPYIIGFWTIGVLGGSVLRSLDLKNQQMALG
jgi:hypothetical protein